MSLIRLSRSLSFLALTCAALLSACGGGGGGGDDEGAPVGTQQYPAGIWEGTVGTGTAQRTMVGFIDGGADGKGGEFYLARGAAGAAGYDGLYGLLRANLTAVQATGVTYFSVQDGKFASGLTLRGTASADPATGKTVAISGNYSSPANTAAATGTPTPFKLSYSKLNNYPARPGLLAGTYRGSGVFGGQWVLTVTERGTLSGRVGGCNVQGTAAPRSQDSAAYSVTMNLSGDETSCGYRSSQQTGVAVLRFDANDVPNGIWVFTRNSIGSDNTFVLNGLKDPDQGPKLPFGGAVVGNWAGTLTLPAGVTGDRSVWGAVLPDGGLFLYTNSSFNHNALYGQLIAYDSSPQPSRFVSDRDSVTFFDRQLNGSGSYVGGVQVELVAEGVAGPGGGASRLTGSYSYPTQPGGYPTQLVLEPDALYTLPAGSTASIGTIVGSYRMPGVGFGGHTVDMEVAADGSITGETSNGCLIVGKLVDLGDRSRNLYRVEAFGYLDGPMVPSNSIDCELSTGPSQSGAASALFSANGAVAGLRILAAGESSSGQRAHTVFVGNKR
ncbi:hypothetical protein [Pulveribacter sp.]|uniref:hypothetical protein n=1 Tax=Pulveribacter sp. TaxID=2678893 RepID=UPI0028B1A00B|nr:hypothetical protein [Pulveribacter sp.]